MSFSGDDEEVDESVFCLWMRMMGIGFLFVDEAVSAICER